MTLAVLVATALGPAGAGRAQPVPPDLAERGPPALGPVTSDALPSGPAKANPPVAAGQRLGPEAHAFPPAPTRVAALGTGALSDVGRSAGADGGSSPRAACLRAVRQAEAVHGLPEGLLVAIALSESGLHAHALNIGGRAHYPDDPAEARAMLRRAAGRSVMAGCLQVNVGAHARNADWPLDPMRAADWAAQHLRRWYLATGTWTQALARWHGGSAAGTRRLICRVRGKLEVAAPGSDILAGSGCGGSEIARVRRSGTSLLELAEAADR